ncbi:MAG: cytochrome c oxidase assembly factor Coa1 family protein [Aequorivita antarctica]
MDNELIKQKNWWKSNWKWFTPMIGIILIFLGIFFSSGMDVISTDLVQAYTDVELYENALEKANANERVSELLGDIQPIDKLAILEGQVEYSNNNTTVNSSIRVVGLKGKAIIDISADRINDTWSYKKIQIRIKAPPEKKQTIVISILE